MFDQIDEAWELYAVRCNCAELWHLHAELLAPVCRPHRRGLNLFYSQTVCNFLIWHILRKQKLRRPFTKWNARFTQSHASACFYARLRNMALRANIVQRSVAGTFSDEGHHFRWSWKWVDSDWTETLDRLQELLSMASGPHLCTPGPNHFLQLPCLFDISWCSFLTNTIVQSKDGKEIWTNAFIWWGVKWRQKPDFCYFIITISITLQYYY